MFLYTGEIGIPLREILDKPYDIIECRCRWMENGGICDELFGFCKWDGENLISLDGDSYSLDDLYVKWKDEGDRLVVWEEGYLSDEWRK